MNPENSTPQNQVPTPGPAPQRPDAPEQPSVAQAAPSIIPEQPTPSPMSNPAVAPTPTPMPGSAPASVKLAGSRNVMIIAVVAVAVVIIGVLVYAVVTAK